MGCSTSPTSPIQGGGTLVESITWGITRPGQCYTLLLSPDNWRDRHPTCHPTLLSPACQSLCSASLPGEARDMNGSFGNIVQDFHVRKKVELLEYHAHFVAHLPCFSSAVPTCFSFCAREFSINLCPRSRLPGSSTCAPEVFPEPLELIIATISDGDLQVYIPSTSRSPKIC